MSFWEYGRAICYSGFRTNQSPITGICPSYEEVLEDLEILVADGYKYLRMYEPNEHARTVVRVIRENSLPLKIMIGIDPKREYNNIGCSWITERLSAAELLKNATHNDRQIRKLISLANEYEDVIMCVSIGNENRPFWGSDLVPKDRLVEFARTLKAGCKQPVTYNEGTSEWLDLEELVEILDIISIHSYPLWNGRNISEALSMNIEDYNKIKDRYPDKEIIFTECGWATVSNSNQMVISDVNPENQKRYLSKLWDWTDKEGIQVFVFEAFDEPWKGSDSADEPEKHWGIYDVNRRKKW